MASPRTTPGRRGFSHVGGGGVTPVYRETFGVNTNILSNGRRSEPQKFGAGALTRMGMSLPEGGHQSQPSIGSRSGSR